VFENRRSQKAGCDHVSRVANEFATTPFHIGVLQVAELYGKLLFSKPSDGKLAGNKSIHLVATTTTGTAPLGGD
jgi:hypothetical protein